MMMKLDSIDRKILAVLYQNARVSQAELAEQVPLSASAAARRLRALEESGLIEGYETRISPRVAGFPVTALVQITLRSQSEAAMQEFERAVRNCRNILACYLLTGEYDYLLRLAVRDIEDYESLHQNVLSKIPGVARIHTSFALREVVNRMIDPLMPGR